MKAIVLLFLIALASGCAPEATPQAAVHSAMGSKEKASALQTETQARNTEGERLADGK